MREESGCQFAEVGTRKVSEGHCLKAVVSGGIAENIRLSLKWVWCLGRIAATEAANGESYLSRYVATADHWPKLCCLSSIGDLFVNKSIAVSVLLVVALVSCSMKPQTKATEAGKGLEITFNVHSQSAELLHEWFNNSADETTATQLLVQPGTQIMAECVRATLPQDQLSNFADDLRLFSRDRKLKADPYGIDLAWRQKGDSALLLQAIKKRDFSSEVASRVAAYIPTEYPLNLSCDVYLVLTGWEWGDAMVRRVKQVGDSYKLSDDGRPVIIINLSIMTHLYGKEQKLEELVDHISHSLIHEGFHFTFARYRDISPRWNTKRDASELEALIEMMQDEGIAHYISHHLDEKLIANYNQLEEYKSRERDAFRQLGVAVRQLSDPSIDGARKKQILETGNASKFWSKYASISGMFMVYHIERTLGKAAVRETLAQGAVSFLTQYHKVQTQNPQLPPLPSELRKMVEG